MYHGQLHDVGGSALQGHVDGGAVSGFADHEIGRLDVRRRPAAAQQSFDVALLLGLFADLFDIFFQLGPDFEISLSINSLASPKLMPVLWLRACGPRPYMMPKFTSLTDERWALVTSFGCDAVNLGGGLDVDVGVAVEGSIMFLSPDSAAAMRSSNWV